MTDIFRARFAVAIALAMLALPVIAQQPAPVVRLAIVPDSLTSRPATPPPSR